MCWNTLTSSGYKAAVGLGVGLLFCLPVLAQVTPQTASELRDTIGNRIETFTILSGDQGFSGGTFYPTSDTWHHAEMDIDKFGGGGELGDPRPIGSTGIAWQPRIEGGMGFLDAKNTFDGGPLASDTVEYKSFGIQFGGGARFWLGKYLSFSPTIMGMYGHTKNEYTHRSGAIDVAEATRQGLINWSIDTWTVLPAVDVQYQRTWGRTVFTLNSDVTYFHTESFNSTSSLLNISGSSECWRNRIDVDAPLGYQLFGKELRTGGYFSRMEFYDGLRSGLHTDHLYEIHPRIVLDCLGEHWKVQWIGLGGSYMWGTSFDGWTVGADIEFRF